MNDPRQEPIKVYYNLVAKCKQDRNIASVADYLRAQRGKGSPPINMVNQTFKFVLQEGSGSGGEPKARVCYRYYWGMACKFGDQCRHAHLEKGTAAHRAFERDPEEMERYNAWLEKQKDAAAGSPKVKPPEPPSAVHAVARAKVKKKKKKGSGAGKAANAAAAQGSEELAPKLSGTVSQGRCQSLRPRRTSLKHSSFTR